MTHLTADLHLIGMFPEMTADLNINPRSNTRDQPKDPHPPRRHHPGKHKDKRHKQVTIDDPLSEYYSSDDNDSDSEDEYKLDVPSPTTHSQRGLPSEGHHHHSPYHGLSPWSLYTQESVTKC